MAVAVAVPLLSIGLYLGLSDWEWDRAEAETQQADDMDTALAGLEAKLAKNPEDIEGWLMLGKSYTAVGRPARAVDAFQKAYDVSKGENIEAVVGLGEALALTDEASMTGRAGALFNEALERDPNHPKALWYGAVAALRAGDLKVGRDRLQLLLAQNPPEQMRGVIESQIQDLNQQLGETGEGTPAATGATPALPPSHPPIPASPTASPAATPTPAAEAPAGQKVLRVAVTIAPEVKKQLSGDVPLFIIARDPAGGPPLAVQRRTSSAAPLTVEFKESDAMVAGRSIGTVASVQVVARLARSGTPQQQSGDFYGEATYEFGKSSGTLNIMVDRTVP
jgi:cytochrome c-type biogenesis protein CcmH